MCRTNTKEMTLKLPTDRKLRVLVMNSFVLTLILYWWRLFLWNSIKCKFSRAPNRVKRSLPINEQAKRAIFKMDFYQVNCKLRIKISITSYPDLPRPEWHWYEIKISITLYGIYSIRRPRRLLNFWTLCMGACSRRLLTTRQDGFQPDRHDKVYNWRSYNWEKAWGGLEERLRVWHLK